MNDDRYIFDIQLDLLKTELNHINGTIRQHDDITKNIKNWAIVAWTASVGFALNKPELHKFIFVTSVIPMLFWIVDGTFRHIQRSFIVRGQEISEFINSDDFLKAAESGGKIQFNLLIMRKRTSEFKNTLIGVMLFRSVSLFYIGLSASSVLIWYLLRLYGG